MLKTNLSEEIIRYTFDPLPGKHFGNSIIALIDGHKALLIDTAYGFQALEVLDDIRNNGMDIAGIIISHFHDDHMQGLKVLPNAPIYGSEHYEATLEMWTEREEHKYFVPTVLIKDTTPIKFGKHDISLIPFPGHSKCTVITKIGDRYIHVADEIMFSNEGRPILPSADPNRVERHINSLKALKHYNNRIFIPGHGMEFGGSSKINKEIDNRIAYFNAILSSSRKITYEEAVKDCDCEFLHSEWHKYVYE